MRFFEFNTQQQTQINALKLQKDNASKALKTARAVQKKQKANDAVKQANQTLAKI